MSTPAPSAQAQQPPQELPDLQEMIPCLGSTSQWVGIVTPWLLLSLVTEHLTTWTIFQPDFEFNAISPLQSGWPLLQSLSDWPRTRTR